MTRPVPDPARPLFQVRRPTRRAARGFTLTELMIVVVIVSVLAAVGYPSYMDHLVRGNITSATAALGDMRMAMEQYYQSNRTYVGGPCGTSSSVDAFTVACTGSGNPAANSFTLSATGSGLANGFTFTLDHHGSQVTTALPGSWGSVPTGGYPCWVVRKGQAC